MGRMHVADFKASTLAGQTARSKSRQAALVGDFRKRVGLVHELRKLRGTEEFTNSSSSRLRVDEVLRHDRIDFDRGHTFLDRALHAEQTDAILVFHQLADRTHAAVAEIVDVVDLAATIAQFHQHLDHGQDIFLAQHAHGVFRVEVQTHVHLHAANGRKVVAFGIEEQRMEHGLSRIHSRRFTRTHDAVDVEQCFLAALVLVDSQRVADIRTDIDMVDIENVDFRLAGIDQGLENLFIDFVTGFEINLASCVIDDIFRQIRAEQIVFRRLDGLEALFGKLLGRTRGQLLACFQNDLARIGINEIGDDLHALEAFGGIRNAPVIAVTGIGDSLVERGQNFFAVHAERHQQRRGRQLAPTVDARIDDVLGIELDIEPRTAIRNDARSKQQLARRMGLALVMIEEDARRTVHLRNDHALGAVDDEGAVVGHERHIAHVHVLLLDVLDGLRTGVFVNIEHDKTQRHLERRRISQIALTAFINIELRWIEFVANEFEHGSAGEILDRENRLENRLQTLVRTPAGWFFNHKELVVRCLLNLDKVRHLGDLGDLAEKFAYALATIERMGLSHRRSSFYSLAACSRLAAFIMRRPSAVLLTG